MFCLQSFRLGILSILFKIFLLLRNIICEFLTLNSITLSADFHLGGGGKGGLEFHSCCWLSITVPFPLSGNHILPDEDLAAFHWSLLGPDHPLASLKVTHIPSLSCPKGSKAGIERTAELLPKELLEGCLDSKLSLAFRNSILMGGVRKNTPKFSSQF